MESTMKHKKKVAIVFGTRPEAIKMAPVIKELKKNEEYFETVVISTAQHREMLDQVLEVFEIEPDYDLNIMKKNQSLSDITSEVLKGLEKIYQNENLDIVLVHGDTTTSFSAALAAFYQRIPIGHVEAGLRTYDRRFPYPEEGNRQLIDNLTDLYFVPTEESKNNLLNENKVEGNISVTGNTVIDAIKFTQELTIKDPLIEKISSDKRWILLTMHRRENYGKPMQDVFEAVKQIIDEYEDVAVLMPVHLSPIVQAHVRESLEGHEKIQLIEPISVSVFHKVMARASIVLTDSGGLQEEAPALDKPVLVLRDKTERPEGEKAGTLKVVGTSTEKVYDNIKVLLDDQGEYERMANSLNPYGDGLASKRIIKKLKEWLF